MATSQTCCHLPDELLNSAAECADRARMQIVHVIVRGDSKAESATCRRPLRRGAISAIDVAPAIEDTDAELVKKYASDAVILNGPRGCLYTCDFPYKSPYDSVYELLPKVSSKIIFDFFC
jgi:hypothetical protein